MIKELFAQMNEKNRFATRAKTKANECPKSTVRSSNSQNEVIAVAVGKFYRFILRYVKKLLNSIVIRQI